MRAAVREAALERGRRDPARARARLRRPLLAGEADRDHHALAVVKVLGHDVTRDRFLRMAVTRERSGAEAAAVMDALREAGAGIRGDIRLRLLRDTTLVCEVWDNGYAQPRRRRARETDEGGRGLQLVSMLADRWGSRRTPSGKTVWFELSLPRT